MIFQRTLFKICWNREFTDRPKYVWEYRKKFERNINLVSKDGGGKNYARTNDFIF